VEIIRLGDIAFLFLRIKIFLGPRFIIGTLRRRRRDILHVKPINIDSHQRLEDTVVD
jgi:hypothetical protein